MRCHWGEAEIKPTPGEYNDGIEIWQDLGDSEIGEEGQKYDLYGICCSFLNVRTLISRFVC